MDLFMSRKSLPNPILNRIGGPNLNMRRGSLQAPNVRRLSTLPCPKGRRSSMCSSAVGSICSGGTQSPLSCYDTKEIDLGHRKIIQCQPWKCPITKNTITNYNINHRDGNINRVRSKVSVLQEYKEYELFCPACDMFFKNLTEYQHHVILRQKKKPYTTIVNRIQAELDAIKAEENSKDKDRVTAQDIKDRYLNRAQITKPGLSTEESNNEFFITGRPGIPSPQPLGNRKAVSPIPGTPPHQGPHYTKSKRVKQNPKKIVRVKSPNETVMTITKDQRRYFNKENMIKEISDERKRAEESKKKRIDSEISRVIFTTRNSEEIRRNDDNAKMIREMPKMGRRSTIAATSVDAAAVFARLKLLKNNFY